MSSCFKFDFVVVILLVTTATSINGLQKRELPLSYSCDPSELDSCRKGDLISTSVADCNYKSYSTFTSCHPINDYPFSSVVDIPDVSKHRSSVTCVPKSGLPVLCGSAGTNTRCVCNKVWDYKQLRAMLFNQCRCQYWPEVDVRMNQPSYCTQYDHGGKSGIHFFTCCNNCNDDNQQCAGTTYQGGGSTWNYCDQCGQSSSSGGGRITYRFNCVSCKHQAACETKCNNYFFGLARYTPGFCPRWAGCFRGCCLEAERLSTMSIGRGK